MLSVCLLLNLNVCEIEAQNLKLKKQPPTTKNQNKPQENLCACFINRNLDHLETI